MNRLLRNILVVLGLSIALTAGGLALVFAPAKPPAASAQPRTELVLVAARPIMAGSRITKADLRWEPQDRSVIPAGALRQQFNTDLTVIGAIALRNLAAGELVAEKSFAPVPSTVTLAASLNPGWRAVTIKADASHTAAGMLLPNDRVDLLLSSAPTEGGQVSVNIPFAKAGGSALGAPSAIISNVRVIAINGAMKPKDDSGVMGSGAGDGGTLTLEVLPDQVAPIMTAATAGQLAISLRSRFDTVGQTAQTDRKAAATAAARTTAAKPAEPVRQGGPPIPKAPRAVAPGSAVTIIRGGDSQRAQ